MTSNEAKRRAMIMRCTAAIASDDGTGPDPYIEPPDDADTATITCHLKCYAVYLVTWLACITQSCYDDASAAYVACVAGCNIT